MHTRTSERFFNRTFMNRKYEFRLDRFYSSGFSGGGPAMIQSKKIIPRTLLAL